MWSQEQLICCCSQKTFLNSLKKVDIFCTVAEHRLHEISGIQGLSMKFLEIISICPRNQLKQFQCVHDSSGFQNVSTKLVEFSAESFFQTYLFIATRFSHTDLPRGLGLNFFSIVSLQYRYYFIAFHYVKQIRNLITLMNPFKVKNML